jgi:hypothetical protein
MITNSRFIIVDGFKNLEQSIARVKKIKVKKYDAVALCPEHGSRYR